LSVDLANPDVFDATHLRPPSAVLHILSKFVLGEGAASTDPVLRRSRDNVAVGVTRRDGPVEIVLTG
jgi:hypothetical protein